VETGVSGRGAISGRALGAGRLASAARVIILFSLFCGLENMPECNIRIAHIIRYVKTKRTDSLFMLITFYRPSLSSFA
jgi:hypothetical protein